MDYPKKLDSFIPYGRHSITDDDVTAVIKTLRSDWLTQGPTVREFENSLEDYLGVKHAVAVNNGTTALHLAYAGLGMNETSTILTTPLTFVATVNAARYQRTKVNLVDIDLDNWNLSIDAVSQENSYTHIVPVHFAGLPVEIDIISKLAGENGAKVITDSSHALGAEYKDAKIGSKNCDASTYSFHPVKHIASGEGGAVVTNNDVVADKLRMLRTHGIVHNNFKEDTSKEEKPYYYEMQELGFNYRIPDILCSLAISQLSRIEENIMERNRLAGIYLDLIEDWGHAKTQIFSSNTRHAYHIFPIVFNGIGIAKRDQIFRELRKLNIGVQIHYIPIPLQPYYKETFNSKDFPNTMYYYENCMTIPLYPSLGEENLKICFDYLKYVYSNVCN